jgi:hypothetical protein
MFQFKYSKHDLLCNLDLTLVGISDSDRALLDLLNSLNV